MSRYKRKYKVLEIDVEKEYGEKLARFGAALPKIINYSLGDIAHEMGDFIRENYLNGRVLKRQTGETADSTKGYQPQSGDRAWLVDFGVADQRETQLPAQVGGRASGFHDKGQASLLIKRPVYETC